MPVPVPCHSKQPSHLVFKPHNSDDGLTNSFQSLTGTLPVSPTGPPPSFGTREQWINSLPSWRRSKPRRIWEDDSHSLQPSSEQDFLQGLAFADNASVIKGSRAKACVPPFPTQPDGLASTDAAEVDSSDFVMYSAEPSDAAEPRTEHQVSSIATYDEQDRGAFTPIFEDESPEARSLHETSSSPVEPVTPFGDFVDRAVSTAPYLEPNSGFYLGATTFVSESLSDDTDDKCRLQGYRFQSTVDMPKEPLPAPASAPELVTPTATSGYRRLSEPLSEWIANFIWRACTTGTNLPSFIVRPRPHSSKVYSLAPPSHLATSVHSLLLSTLLQPSAIFLALWYIVRLPMFLGFVNLSTEHRKELRFRVALLGEPHALDRDALESSAPFRLIVLGCMLANKWLDDHTFSNKTWHSISSVPIQTLNRLESLTLDIFAHDLSISPGDWSDWLSHIMAYHSSLSSPSRQPISRPSANPHLIIRLAIEEIVQAPAACNFDRTHPQPVFIGLEERRKDKAAKEQAQQADVLEIDLDEDGPLREEYMPKRRVSGASSTHNVENASVERRQSWEQRSTVESCLPPPAKWSPAGDEPILRDSNRAYGRYVAVQPTPGLAVPPYQVLPSYPPAHDVVYTNQPWLPNGPFSAAKPLPTTGHIFDYAPLQQHPAPPAYNPCPLLLPPFALSHSRSQSQSYSHDQDTSHSRNHTRSYSQSQFEYRSSDLRMTANELAPVHQDADIIPWGGIPGHYAYSAPAYAPHPSVYQSSWLRT